MLMSRSHVRSSRLVLVCSARSTDSKAEGTTNRLLKASKEAEKLPRTDDYKMIIKAIQDDHTDAAGKLIKQRSILDTLVKDIQSDCIFLTGLLGAAQFLQEVSPKTLDNILATGEKLSCKLMAALLQDRGVDAEYVGMEDVIRDYDASNGLDQAFYDHICVQMAKRIEACGTKVPVVTGTIRTVRNANLKI